MIVYASRTGNVRYAVSRLQLPAVEMKEDLALGSPFLLFTYTDGLGAVPRKVERFLERYAEICRGVIASGNSNFGHRVFAAAGDKIARQWRIPLVRKIDMRGFPEDYEAIKRYYAQRFQEGERNG